MKTYKPSYKANTISLKNYERIDNQVLFEKLINKLSRVEGITLSSPNIAPTENYVKGSYSDIEFTLYHDISYGSVDVCCSNEDTLETLKQIIEQD